MANRNIIINYTIPKTFVLAGKSGHVYVPRPRWLRKNNVCCCVYVCPQFLTYARNDWGNFVIPITARCPHTNGRCVGANWWDRDKGKVTYYRGMPVTMHLVPWLMNAHDQR